MASLFTRLFQRPRRHLGDEFLPGTVTGESLVRICCGEGELIPERRQAEVLVERRNGQVAIAGRHVATVYGLRMEVAELAHLRRARDLLDREYAQPLDVPTMARAALMSPSLFSRRFREAYGDTPYGYLQARRVERAMALLRFGHMSVTDVCMAVGFTSLGSFSSTFTRLVGEPPSVYKARDHSRLTRVPPCMTRAWARPRWIAQPCRIGEAFLADHP